MGAVGDRAARGDRVAAGGGAVRAGVLARLEGGGLVRRGVLGRDAAGAGVGLGGGGAGRGPGAGVLLARGRARGGVLGAQAAAGARVVQLLRRAGPLAGDLAAARGRGAAGGEPAQPRRRLLSGPARRDRRPGRADRLVGVHRRERRHGGRTRPQRRDGVPAGGPAARASAGGAAGGWGVHGQPGLLLLRRPVLLRDPGPAPGERRAPAGAQPARDPQAGTGPGDRLRRARHRRGRGHPPRVLLRAGRDPGGRGGRRGTPAPPSEGVAAAARARRGGGRRPGRLDPQRGPLHAGLPRPLHRVEPGLGAQLRAP